MIQAIRLIGLFFGFAMLYFTFVNYKREEISFRGYVFWSMAWLGFIIFIMMPPIVDTYLGYLGFTGLVQFLTIMGFLFVFSLIFYMYKKIIKIQKKMELLVKELAKK